MNELDEIANDPTTPYWAVQIISLTRDKDPYKVAAVLEDIARAANTFRARKSISNTDNLIHSRDVFAVMDELSVYHDDDELLSDLEKLAYEASSSSRWEGGTTLIRDSYFTTHARHLAEELGRVARTSAWPLNHVDWESAARELKNAYFDVVFRGVVYWVAN